MISGKMILIAIVVGLIIALIVVSVMRASLKSIHKQLTAKYYEREEGLTLTNSKDIFLYKRTDRTAKPKEQPKQQN